MREIKFRGKRINNGEWVYGDIIHSAWKTFTKDCNDKYTNPRRLAENTADFRCIEVAPSTVGQYIGLKDINGKEIYEGDIVRHNYGFGNGKGIVCYSAPNLELKHLNKNEVCNDFTWDEWELFEIIGNIHDNPELLGDTP